MSGLVRAILWIVMAGVIVMVVSVAALVHGYSTGWLVPDRTAPELAAELSPHLETVRPEGAGPFPVLMILPGCGGVRETFHTDWAMFGARNGYLSVIVDSFTPRDMDRETALSQVCTGRKLWGRERAGDILALLEALPQLADADPSRVVLLGQSHGAWSVMDLMAMDLERRGPTNLWPLPDASVREAVMANVLLYPYCGYVSLSGEGQWHHTPRTLMINAENDEVVSRLACETAAQKLAANDVPVTVRTMKNARHAFDDFTLPFYDEAASAQTKDLVGALLREMRDTR